MTSTALTPKHRTRWVVALITGLLLTGCLFWSGLFWSLPLLPAWWSNHLTRVQGKAELLVPGRLQPDLTHVSPDGRTLLTRWLAEDYNTLIVWDLTTDTQQTLAVRYHGVRWLTPDLFVIRDAPRYYVVAKDHLQLTPVEPWPTDTYFHANGLQTLAPILRNISPIYVVERWSGRYQLFFRHDAQWYFVSLGAYELQTTIAELDQFLATIPHIHVPYQWNTVTTTNEHIPSPDGQWTATREWHDAPTERAAIYTADGVLVAEAYKAGWDPYVLGWAHDSSGIYIQYRISGSAAAVLVPYSPIFKLSPLTPAEQRWHLAQRIGLGVGGVLLLVGTGWWWRRRRRRTVAA